MDADGGKPLINRFSELHKRKKRDLAPVVAFLGMVLWRNRHTHHAQNVASLRVSGFESQQDYYALVAQR